MKTHNQNTTANAIFKLHTPPPTKKKKTELTTTTIINK